MKILRIHLMTVFFSVSSAILFLIGALMIYSSKDTGLFFKPESAIARKNADLIQRSHPNLKDVLNSFVNESLAERARLQSLQTIWVNLGELLITLSVIQFGLISIFLFRRCRKLQ